MMPFDRLVLSRFPLLLGAAAAAFLAAPPAPAQEAPPPPATDAAIVGQETPIIPLSDVRIGMKGYGLTVFHGTKIEPFPVEVVSVISDFSPGRGTIWIRSDHPILNVSGPVQGMSGSPIFLWDEGEEGTLGEGGRLSGAFAYGYSMVKECLAGVQPIELMRAVGDDIDRTPPEPGATARRAGSPVEAVTLMRRLQSLASARQLRPSHRYRLDALARVMERQVGREVGDAKPLLPEAPRGFDDTGVQRLMLPMSVASPRVAEFGLPLLEPLGITPVAGGIAGPPPAGTDVEGTTYAPGSVLSVPLAFGDLDLSAAGTVTEVRPDGTVLGFGHAMFGEGAVGLPMATGYVHFFVPRITTSFKQMGSLRLLGSLVQDQNAAVAGIDQARYELAPVRIDFEMPGYRESFSYQAVNHPRLTPTLTALLTLQSLTASREFPLEHTVRLTGRLGFSGGRTIEIDSLTSGQGPEAAVLEMMPVVAAMMNNPHENLLLTGVELSATVEPELKVGTLVNARLEKAEVAPGERVRLTATMQPYGRPAELIHAELKVPEGLAEGDYPLALMDASTYTSQVLMSRPHLRATSSVDDLVDTVRRIMAVENDAVYLVLQLPEEGIAIGRSELPRLPSSRKAMIATPTSTLATPFMETAVAVVPTDVVVQGQLAFQLSVRRPAATRLQPVQTTP